MEIIYPVSGAKLVCDKGTRYAHFYAGSRFSTMGTGRVGIETDSSPENVAGNFFKCTVTGAECDKCFSGDWQNVSREITQQDGDGSPRGLLTMRSSLHCARMGTITFLTDGQEMIDNIKMQELQMGNLRERVRRTIYAHYGFTAPTEEDIEAARQNAAAAADTSGMTEEEAAKAREEAGDAAAENMKSMDDKLYEELRELGATPELIDAIKKTGKKVCEGGDQGYKDEREAFERLRKSNTKLMEQVPFVHRAGYQTLLNSLKDSQEALISEGEYDEARELITAELAGMDEAQSLKIKRRIETRQLADKVIELFKVNEDNPAKEQDPCTLLAWLVLLRENYEGEVTTLESLEEAVAAGDYEAYGLMPSHRGFFREEAFEGYLNHVKQMAYDLPVQYPLYGGFMTWNYRNKEPTYVLNTPGDHTGVDIGGGYAYDLIAPYSGTIKQNSQLDGLGIVVKIRDSKHDYLLCHCASVNEDILLESFVLAGKYVAIKGNTGAVQMVVHLHYEVRNAGAYYGNDLDPNNYLPQQMQEMGELRGRGTKKPCGILGI